MEACRPPDLALAPSGVPAAVGRSGVPAAVGRSGVPAAVGAGRSVRLPEAVYRRRRMVVAMIVVAAMVLVLALGRPDRVPPGEANPWSSTGDASLPAELPGVYVVQPGDTLWYIALAIAPGGDPRALVHGLAEAAGGAALEPGQPIMIDASVLSDNPDGANRQLGRQAPGPEPPVSAANRAGKAAPRRGAA